MTNNGIIWLATIFIIVSLIYTGCSYLQKDDADKEKHKTMFPQKR